MCMWYGIIATILRQNSETFMLLHIFFLYMNDEPEVNLVEMNELGNLILKKHQEIVSLYFVTSPGHYIQFNLLQLHKII